MLNDLIMVLHFGNARLYITARRIGFAFRLAAFNHKPAAFGFAFFNRIKIKINRIPVYQRAHMIIFIQRVANFYLLISFHQFLFKGLINTFVDNKPAGTGAALAGGTHRAKHSANK